MTTPHSPLYWGSEIKAQAAQRTPLHPPTTYLGIYKGAHRGREPEREGTCQIEEKWVRWVCINQFCKGEWVMIPEDCPDQYVFDQTINIQREEYLTSQLIAFNQKHSTALPIEQVDPLPLQISLLDPTGTVLGGLVGRTHTIPQWLEISIIWIDESLRRSGLGRRLMEEAEREARQRGCHYARVTTSDFQAPGFYRKLGYILYGTLENCPPGETVFYFWKKLE